MTQDEQSVHPANTPGLQAILRRGLLSRCGSSRPRARAGIDSCRSSGSTVARGVRAVDPDAASRRTRPGLSPRPPAHRASLTALWLDRPDTVVTDIDGRYIRTIDRHTFTCQDQSVDIPTRWLREQIAAGRRRRVIDEATRREMGVMPTSLRGHKHH